MKRERRHELQHNDLAEWIVTAYGRIEPYRNVILVVAVLTVVLGVGFSFWHSHNVAQAAEAWNSLGVPVFQPNFVDGQTTMNLMDAAIKSHPDAPVAEWAKVFEGNTFLLLGSNQILADKKRGVELLTQAQTSTPRSCPG